MTIENSVSVTKTSLSNEEEVLDVKTFDWGIFDPFSRMSKLIKDTKVKPPSNYASLETRLIEQATTLLNAVPDRILQSEWKTIMNILRLGNMGLVDVLRELFIPCLRMPDNWISYEDLVLLGIITDATKPSVQDEERLWGIFSPFMCTFSSPDIEKEMNDSLHFVASLIPFHIWKNAPIDVIINVFQKNNNDYTVSREILRSHAKIDLKNHWYDLKALEALGVL